MSSAQLGEHFFRHEYGRLVATLSRRVGVGHLEAVEDAVQFALMRAVETWNGRPPNEPSAWLFRVAHNALLTELRRSARRARILASSKLDLHADEGEPPAPPLPGELHDDLLRLLFVGCDDAIPVESQLVLALKTLCGFDVREIGQRLFLTPANVYKRLTRARARLRQEELGRHELGDSDYAARLPAVRQILYLMFTEGHLSTGVQLPIRRELCDEAIRLATLLAGHPRGQGPTSAALLALMHLHSARMDARMDAAGALRLLEEQDRSIWDRDAIEAGLMWLARAADGDEFSRYHAEAGIAAEHSLAPTFEATRWDRVVELYAMWERVSPSPLHRLHRALAVAEHEGPSQGLAVLEGFEPPTWLSGSYQWSAALADLHFRCGHATKAREHADRAIERSPTDAIRAALRRRWDRASMTC